MLGKPFQTFNVIHICMGTIIILSITKVCSDNYRYKTGMWSIDPQAFFVYNQPSKFRKLYWYATRIPPLSARKQRMGNFQLKHGYRNGLPEMGATYGNQLRSTFKNTYDDGSMSTKALRTYSMSPSVRMPTTSVPMTTRGTTLFERKQPDFRNITTCKQNQNITLATEGSHIINILPHFRGLESISSISNTIPPIIEPPFQPYVTHTYFTLDDVIVPNAPRHFNYKSDQEKLIRNDLEPQNSFIATKSKLSTHYIDQILGTSTSTTIEPIKTTAQILVTTTTRPIKTTVQTLTTNTFEPIKSTVQLLETSTMEPIRPTETIVQTTLSVYPQTTTFLSKPEPTFEKENINLFKLSRTVSTHIPNTMYNKKNMTFKKNISYRKNLTLATFKDEFCYTCGRTLLKPENKTSSHVRISHFSEGKLKENSSTKVMKPNFSRKKQNTPILSVKIKATPKNRTETQTLSKNQSVPILSSTPEPTQMKNRRNKTNFMHVRRRKLDVNATRLKTQNLTRTESVEPIILKPKPEVKNSTVNTILNEPKVHFRDTKKININNSSIWGTTATISETTALAAESAIMTISNTNGKYPKRPMRTFRKQFPTAENLDKRGFMHTTEVPKLPIEVYFTKLNKN